MSFYKHLTIFIVLGLFNCHSMANPTIEPTILPNANPSNETRLESQINVAQVEGKSSQTQIASNTPSRKTSKKGKTKSERFGDRRDVQIWIWDMHVKNNFSAQELKTLFRTISHDQKVIEAISKPFEEVPWNKYRERFVNDARAKAGVQFWNANEAALKKAQAEYGVPPEVIVAIIGVETNYGQNRGNFLVLQALATLAFDYPPRSPFFKKELEQFLLLTREEKLDPRSIYGSYAGAMGLPQFMPSSYREFAVDFTGNGKRDLINNTDDAIGSVANYFKMHGWIPNEPVAYLAQGYGSEFERLATTNQKDPKPKLSLGELAKFNIVPKDKNALKNKDRLAAFIMLPTDDKPELWLALQNFYAITRYNHSVNYAMAVHQLSQRIRELHG